MKKLSLALIAILIFSIILIGCGKAEEKVFGEGETGEEINYAQVNCELSGGTYAEEACSCPDAYAYNEKSGFCTDADGAPGGELGLEMDAEEATPTEEA